MTATLLAEASSVSSVLIVVAAIVLAFTFGRLARRRSADASGADGGDGGGDPSAHVRRVQEAGDEALRQIESLGRETVARAETRLRVLNELLVRAERLTARDAASAGDAVADGFAQVCRLADEGLDPGTIAERTEFQRTEVELMLSLRKRSTRSKADRPGKTP
jgi:hypothetical protein